MGKKIVLIHTVKETLNSLDEYIYTNTKLDVNITNLYDDGFARPVYDDKGETTHNSREKRLRKLISVAEDQKPDLIFVACSTLSLEAESLKREISTPIVTVDEAMIDVVTDQEDSVVLFATSPNPVYSVKTRLIQAAKKKEKSIEIKTALCEQALPYLLKNDIENLKQTAINYIKDFKPVDNIVFAQLSSQCLREQFESITGKKVYTSKDLICKEIEEKL